MMRPTLRAVLLFVLSIPAAVIVLAWNRDAWIYFLNYPIGILVLIGVDALATLPGRRLDADIHCPPRLHVAVPAQIDLTLTATGRNRIATVEALLEQTGDADPPHIVFGKMAGRALTLALPLLARRRGQLKLDALWLRWKSPLGLIVAQKRQPVDTIIDIVPDVRGIQDAALQFFDRDAVFGIKTQRLRGEGTEFDTLCEYTTGMDSRFIDWKRSARHRKLLSKEFRQERNHHIVFGFDTGHLMLEPIAGMPKLDHAIKAGLLLGWISLRSGDIVGGCGFDSHFRHFTKPGRGIHHFTRLQRFAAGLDYRTEETNFTLGLAELNTRLQRRTLVVLFTEFIDTISAELLIESLQVMVRRHVIIFVTLRDPMLAALQTGAPEDFVSTAEAVIADDFLRERAIVLERIARLGVHCIDTRAEHVSAALVNRYLAIKQRGLL